MPDLDIIIVFVVLLFIIVTLYTELLGTAFTFVIAVLVLGLSGIISPVEMLHGFANEQIAVIMFLLLLGDVIRKTNVIAYLFDKIFQGTSSYKGFTSRMIFLVAGLSAFLNNTPLVAVMMPYVHSWSKKHNISPSKLLIPLSYAAILGGCATLIGTSTNLIVNGLLTDQEIIPNLTSLNLFDFAYVGGAMIIIGALYLIFIGDKLLPEINDTLSDFNSNKREYLVETKVKKGSEYIGKNIEEAGLRNLPGLFLVEIIRGDIKIPAVKREEIIAENDILLFAGDTKKVSELINAKKGLVIPAVEGDRINGKNEVVEVVISHNSQLIYKTAKESNFRVRFDASIIAIHRNGERVSGKIGDVKLRAGDVLMLFSGADFHDRANDFGDFYLISKISDVNKFDLFKLSVLIGGTFLAIILSAFHLISLFKALLILLVVLYLLKIINTKDIQKGFDYKLYLIIALALALGKAMINTGVADIISNVLINVFIPMGIIGILVGIYLITTFLAAYITNAATVAIIFPISLTIALNLHLNPMPFILIVAFAAAANFMTPVGYQTNLMVYGPGRYRFKDFFKIGFPLSVLYLIVTVGILYFMYF